MMKVITVFFLAVLLSFVPELFALILLFYLWLIPEDNSEEISASEITQKANIKEIYFNPLVLSSFCEFA